MTILKPNPIIDKLEEDGVETVKAKKAKGLYRDEKMPLINKWLAENDRGKKGVLIHKGNTVDEASPKIDPFETKDKDPESGQWPDGETLAFARMTDSEYKAADSATKRKITMARKKVFPTKE